MSGLAPTANKSSNKSNKTSDLSNLIGKGLSLEDSNILLRLLSKWLKTKPSNSSLKTLGLLKLLSSLNKSPFLCS